MRVEWRADDDSVFLTSGDESLTLQRTFRPAAPGDQRLDHIGFVVHTEEAADRWHDHLRAAGATVGESPKTHRDGARSFFCRDPDGTKVQIHPPPTMSGT